MKCAALSRQLCHLTKTNFSNHPQKWLGIKPHKPGHCHGTREARPYSSNVGNPEIFDDYEWHRKWMENESRYNVPVHYNFARDVIDKWATHEKIGLRNSIHPALWIADGNGNNWNWSFQDLSVLSKKTANVLTGCCGLSPGDTMVVILPRIPQWWWTCIAAIRAGIVFSPGTILLRENDIKHRLHASAAKCIVADSHTVDYVDQVADECPDLKYKIFVGDMSETRSGWLNFDQMLEKSSPTFQTVDTKFNDPMNIFFTSGTTGDPKMAEHTHGSYGYGHIITARYLLQSTASDVVWNMSDTGWAKCAWSSFFAPWMRGGCVFAHQTDTFDPEVTLKILKENKSISVFCAPPTVYRYLVQQPLQKMRDIHCIGGGEPVNPELFTELKEGTGLDLYEGYGQTETTFLCGTYPIIKRKPGSMGKAVPGVDLQVVDDDGNVLPIHTEGHVAVNTNNYRPIGLFTRYVNDEKRTASVFRNGFYLTGDRGYMDEDGYFWFVGREDDVIISSAYRIGPFEVESALQEHQAVTESAVVSSPDDVRGEVVKAFVVLTDAYRDADKDNLRRELQEHVKSVTAPYKYPRKIEFMEQLPKTVSGKIRRVELRNREWQKE